MRHIATWERAPARKHRAVPEPEVIRAMRNKDADAIRYYRNICLMSEKNLVRIYGKRAVREALYGISNAE